ncbi:MAG: hypothetical protein AAGF72_08020 [Pseudomonadota bacterium]
MRTTLLLALLFSAPAHAGWFEHTETRDFSLPAADLVELRIESGHGFVIVEGSPDATAIEVHAEILLPVRNRINAAKIIAEELELSLDAIGSTAQLRGLFTSANRMFGEDPRISLTVRVPASMSLVVDDGTGFIEVEGVDGDVTITDGSGSIDLRAVRGNVTIEDGSGWIDVDDVSASVSIKDRSGGISISRVAGDVTIDDGAGNVAVRDVSGNLNIVDNGSGRVRYSGIGGLIDDRS